MTTNNAPKVGRLLLKRAVSNEGSLSLIIAGKWKGKVNVPKSATVGVLKTHIAAASNMSTDIQQLLFKGKKLTDSSVLLTSLKGMKDKARIFLRCTKVKTVKPMSAGNVAAGELKEKLTAQGAGNIDLKKAEEYINMVKDYDLKDKRSPVLKAIGLFYKSNGNVGAARNIVRVERAERAAAAKKKKEEEEAAKNSTSTDEKKDSTEDDEKESPKKKSKTYKEIMKSITMDKKNSEERREAHKKHLKKNLGGGSFDKIDKI